MESKNQGGLKLCKYKMGSICQSNWSKGAIFNNFPSYNQLVSFGFWRGSNNETVEVEENVYLTGSERDCRLIKPHVYIYIYTLIHFFLKVLPTNFK